MAVARTTKAARKRFNQFLEMQKYGFSKGTIAKVLGLSAGTIYNYSQFKSYDDYTAYYRAAQKKSESKKQQDSLENFVSLAEVQQVVNGTTERNESLPKIVIEMTEGGKPVCTLSGSNEEIAYLLYWFLTEQTDQDTQFVIEDCVLKKIVMAGLPTIAKVLY